MTTAYDRIGHGYAARRRAEPRIAAQIQAALAGMDSVANVGAGAGSYEPPQTVVAIEPSSVMMAQRPAGAAPCLQALAEHLPLADRCVDASMAILTVHHWTDLEAGIAELRRISRRRIVILTWDQCVNRYFWLLREYLPAAAKAGDVHAARQARLFELLPDARVEVVPVPHDCVDGFGAAYWRRPEAYLDADVRSGISMLAQAGEPALADGLSRLADDLASGRWRQRHADLLTLDSLDLGYRLVITDLPAGRRP